MKHDPRKYLIDMLDACHFLQSFTAGKSVEEYRSDRVVRDVVERELQNVGEAVRQLQSRDPKTAERIGNHQRIIRFRHQLVHGYSELRPDLVWEVVVHDLPRLVIELDDVLRSFEKS